MSRFNTGNPLGSGSPLDLDDNAKNLDVLTNSREALSNPDRFGVQRKTWHGMEREHDDAQSSRDDQFQSAQSSREAVFSGFLQASGYQDLGEYAPGIEITAHNQYVTFGGQPYLLKPSITVPYTTSGEWTGDDFKLIGDDSLRQDLANPDMGAAIIARGVVAVDSIADLLNLPVEYRLEGLRYLVKGYHAGSDVGGGSFYYDSSRVDENDGGVVVSGFVRIVEDDNGQVASGIDIRWFGGDIFKATEYVKEDKHRVCIGHPGDVYDYSGTAPLFLNRLICNGGSCTVRIIGDADLRLSNVDDDRVEISGVNLYFSGNRRGPSGVGQKLFADWFVPIRSLRLKNFEVRALLNIDDIDSWSDGEGKTRGYLGFSVEVSKDSVCEDVTFYGTSGLSISTSSPEATHREERITGYNCETLVWIHGAEWRSGTSKHLHIENTEDEQTYHMGMDVGVGINGKDALLCEANHRVIYEIENITANNAIERPVYCQSSNVIFRGGSSNLSAESSFALRGESTRNVSAEQLRATSNINSRSAYITMYGLSGGSFRTINVENIAPSDNGLPLVGFGNRNNNIVVENANCISAGKIVQEGSTSEEEASNMVFRNITTVDDYNHNRAWRGNMFSTYDASGTLYSARDVRLENVRMLLSTDTPLYLNAFAPAIDARGIHGFSVVGCTAYFRIGGILALVDCVDVSVTGSTFLGVYHTNLHYNQIVGNINLTSPLNEFDFRVVLRDDHLARGQGLVSVLEYSKPYSIEPSNITDYLQRFTTTIPYDGGAGSWFLGPASGKELSVKMMYGSAYIIAEKGESDELLSVVEVSGDTFTTTWSERETKLYVSVNVSSGLIGLETRNASLEAGTITVDIRYVTPR